MSNRYHNPARGEQEDKELEELEVAYKKQFGNAPTDDDDGVVTLPVETDEDKTWKKRYSDLRSHSDKLRNDAAARERELAKRIEALEKAKDTDLPATVEEAKAWVQEYPDLSRVLKQLMREEAQYVKDDVMASVEELEAERRNIAKEKALNEIHKAHPDFTDLVESEDFQEWVERQPVERGGIVGQALYDALYNNQTDAKAAIQAVDIYKQDKKASKPVDVSREAVRKVTRTTSTAPSQDGGKPKFHESQIADMSIRDYERYEEQIEEARRDGRIVYDLSGAAR